MSIGFSSLIIISLPLVFNVFACGFFGSLIGFRYVMFLVFQNFILVYLNLLYLGYTICFCQQDLLINLFTWLSAGFGNIEIGFLLDSLSVTMLFVIFTVSFLVHLYSMEYMSQDPYIIRFLSYLSAFTFFMVLFVTSDNFLQMFFGWEGVGICSYLLINFWHTRIAANDAAIKAVLVNRIGDLGILMALALIYKTFGTFNYFFVFNLIPFFIDHITCGWFTVDLIAFFLFIGCIGKSAQLGLHTWLPDAMEGPTPVSALLHAATMVTAGVFLVIRCSAIFEYSPIVLFLICIFGALTAFFAGLVALSQTDIKKIIAYSTCAHLGLMFLSSGLSDYATAFYHLFNHAFFKALLFLSAGSVIHALSGEQDIRKMGALNKVLPLTYSYMLVGILSSIGLPYLSGFYSKELIVHLTYAQYNFGGSFIYWLSSIAVLCSAMYSFKLLFYIFFFTPNFSRRIVVSIQESSFLMLIPLQLLAILSIIGGFLSFDIFVGAGSDFCVRGIFVLPEHKVPLAGEMLSTFVTILPIVLTVSGGLLVYYSSKDTNAFNLFFFSQLYLKFGINNFFIKKWYFDYFYSKYIVSSIFKASYCLFFVYLDKGYFEAIGPLGVVKVIRRLNDIFVPKNFVLIDFLILTLFFGVFLLVYTTGI